MSVAQPSRIEGRANILFHHPIVRYLFAIAMVASTFALRIWLIPFTGTGAPFVLFFAAVLVTSLLAGVAPGICALLISLPVAAYTFVTLPGYPLFQAASQALLFGIDGIVVIYLTHLLKKGRQAAQDANRQLRGANEEITRSMARTREVVELSPDAFFQADLEARLTDVNQAACRLLGYDPDELIGKTIFDIIPLEDAPRLKTVRTELLVPGQVNRAEWTQKRKDGTLVPVEVSSNILPDGRWQAFVRDISERKRIEDERQVFVSFLENSPDFIGIADANGKSVYVNPAGRRMVGLPADYPVENTEIEEYYPADLRAYASDVIVRSAVEQGRWHGETYFRHWQTQEAIPVSDEHFIIRHPETGRILGMGTITRDISDERRTVAEREQLLARQQLARRQAETANEQLRESEERFRLTIDEAPIGMALVSLDGRFVRVNRVLCGIVGYSAAELTSLTFQDITHRDDLDADLELAGQLARGEISRYQLGKRYIRKNGTTIDILLSASILRNREDAPLYYIAQIEDVTERKRAEEALRKSEALNHAVLGSLAANIAVLDRDANIIAVNEAWKRFACENGGAAIADSVGSNYLNACGGALESNEEGQTVRNGIQAVLDGALHDFALEYPCHSPSEKRWFLMSVTPLLGERGGAVVSHTNITERKRVEEALQRSEREFRELAESMPQIVWATRADGWNIYFNQQWVDYTGLTLEESYGEGWINPFHPDDRQRAWDAWQRATQHRDTYSLECRLRRADGVYQWWLIRGVPLLGTNGEISKWFGTCTDIEQIKVAEQRLKESEAKFSGIISISADAIISIDGEQRIMLFNDGAEKIFGYSKSEAIGVPLDILIPERFRNPHRQHVDRFASGNVIARPMGERLTTIAGLRKNGEEFPAEAAISKLQVGDRTLLTVSLRDISERKRVEKEQQFLAEAGALLASSLDYEQTLATVAQLVVRDFADWCIIEVMEEHGQLQRLKVVSADPTKAALSIQLEQIPINRGRPYLLRQVIETKHFFLIEHVSSDHLESVAQGPDHLQLLRAVDPRSLMALPLLIRGELVGILAFISSIPSRTYGPSDLRLAEALADRAAVAIENARLYRASVHATKLRDQVLGVVAHDLRNPLSTILTQLWALKRRGPEPERRSQRPMEVIERAAKRMNRLIQDLLDVAVMEAGQLTIERAQLSASGLVVEAVDMQRLLASSSSLELRVEVDPDVSDVLGDRDRLLQVFENLIGNAIKFTKAGGRITAGAASRNDEVVFWVADTGRGIPSENLPRVFDRFWQATRAGRQGAGLGLPITKGIVEAHGGRIWVESATGRGSTFFFAIPKASAAQDRLSDSRRPDRAA